MSLHQLKWGQGVPQSTPTPWQSLGWGAQGFPHSLQGCLAPRGAGKGHPHPGETIPLLDNFSPPGAQAQTLIMG